MIPSLPGFASVRFLHTLCLPDELRNPGCLFHFVFSGISGMCSICWDSISDVTALAMNSQPTTILRNTCAGIAEIRIFKTPARILTRKDEEGEGEHSELVFGDIDHEDSQKRAVKPNRKYGTLPATISEVSRKKRKSQAWFSRVTR